ncbi:MAG: hypothetical protein JNM10_09410 [Planctomycetia bacterium]|nr:hypothetical protein [Planctomycetia bacterium]
MPPGPYRCPCCEQEDTLVAERPPPGSDGVCIHCYWQDDLVAFRHPDEVHGNCESLNGWRRQFGKAPLPPA